MKKLNTLIGLSILFVATSCNVTKRSVTADTMQILKTDVITKPQIADLNIESRKVEGTAEVRKKDYFPNPTEACINLALKDATTRGNCDVLVQPMYEIEDNSRFVRVKVIGFAASYVKFRALELSDTATYIAFGKINDVVTPEVARPKTIKIDQNNKPVKSKKGKGLVGFILGITFISLILAAAGV